MEKEGRLKKLEKRPEKDKHQDSKPMMSLVSKIAHRSPTLGSGASNSQEILGISIYSSDLSGRGKPVARDVKGVNENTASSSQVWNQNEKHSSRQWETSCEIVKQTQ